MAQTTKEVKKTVKDKNYYNELITIRLFKDTGKYKDDVFVAVNGTGMIVPRGVDVKIPRKYALALRNSEIQDGFAAEYSAKLSECAEAEELN